MEEPVNINQKDLDRLAKENHHAEKNLKTRIVRDWLPRYTGMALDQFGE